MRWRFGSALLAAALAVVAGPRDAHAEPAADGAAQGPRLDLEWESPAQCPASTFRGAFDRLLAGSSMRTPVRVEATVEQHPDRWQVVTRFEAGPNRGERRFHAPACDTVVNAAALAIAIAVDPTVLDRLATVDSVEPVEPAEPELLEPEPEPEPETEAPDPALVVEPPEYEDDIGPIEPIGEIEARGGDLVRSEPDRPLRGFVAGAGMIDGLALPGVGFGATLAGGVTYRWFRAEVVGSYRFPTEQASQNSSDAGGRFEHWTVGVRTCASPRLGPVEVPLCVGADAGQTIGRGYGVTLTQVARLPWLAPVGTVGVAWPVLPRFALFVRSELAVSVLRSEFEIVGLGTIHEIGPVLARGLLGVELRLP